MTNDERLAYSVKETSKLIGLGKTKTQELINSGDLKVKRIGRRTLVLAESVRALLASKD